MKNAYTEITAFIGGSVGLITFVVVWIYATATYGLILGLGLGWLPAYFIALFAGLFAALAWPVVGIGAVLLFMALPH